MSDDIIVLTEEQQLKLLNEWNNRAENPPSLVELVKLAFGRDDLDGRSKEGKAVKIFLASRQIKPKKSHEYQAKGLIELSPEHKEYVSNNCHTMTAVEMAKILFKNETLTNLSQETRSVLEYMKNIPSNFNHISILNTNPLLVTKYLLYGYTLRIDFWNRSLAPIVFAASTNLYLRSMPRFTYNL